MAGAGAGGGGGGVGGGDGGSEGIEELSLHVQLSINKRLKLYFSSILE